VRAVKQPRGDDEGEGGGTGERSDGNRKYAKGGGGGGLNHGMGRGKPLRWDQEKPVHGKHATTRDARELLCGEGGEGGRGLLRKKGIEGRRRQQRKF